MKKLLFISAVAFTALSVSPFATKPFEGTIEYSVNNSAQASSKSPAKRFTVYIKDDKIRIDKEVPFGMIRTLIDSKKDTYLTLYFIDNGKKYVQKSKLETAGTTGSDVAIMKDSTKKINGYKCHLAIVKSATGEQVILFAPEHRLPLGFTGLPGSLTYGITGVHPKLLDKFILSAEISDKNAHATVRVENISEAPVNKSVFSYSEKEFKAVTKEEIDKIIDQAFTLTD